MSKTKNPLRPRFPERSGPPPLTRSDQVPKRPLEKARENAPEAKPPSRPGGGLIRPVTLPVNAGSQPQKDPSNPAFPGGLRCAAEHQPIKDDIAPGKPQDPFFGWKITFAAGNGRGLKI
jgi:hypothetical protein